MNQTFTHYVVMLLRIMRNVGQHYKRQNSYSLLYGTVFCFKLLFVGVLTQTIFILPTYAQQPAAQNIVVKGTVLADEDGAPIPGITISDSNRKVYGVTNEKGDFTLTIPKGSTVNFGMIGLATVSRKFNENQSGVIIRVKEAASQLNEVVVTTALGIKRSEKSLSYAVTKLDSNQITDAVSTNWTDALSGKVAGLNLVRSNSGPAGSNKIILRGENNLTGDNEALIVVDGVVISNSVVDVQQTVLITFTVPEVTICQQIMEAR